jgi:hypothetical protein
LGQPGRDPQCCREKNIMRLVAAIGIAAFAVGTSFAQPFPPSLDRALDCRNPRDAALCRDIQRDQAARSVGPPSTYRAPVARPTPLPPSPTASAKCSPPGLDIGEYAWVRDPKPEDIRDGGWEVCPGKVVMPSIFCRWVRHVLPEEQQKTCKDLEAAALAPAVALAKANPSPALLEYEATMRPIQRNFALAYFASICGLRSNAYLERFALARQLIYEQERGRRRLSAAEWKSAGEEIDRVFSEVLSEMAAPTLELSCRRLQNSEKLDQLDAIERRLTGTYH